MVHPPLPALACSDHNTQRRPATRDGMEEEAAPPSGQAPAEEAGAAPAGAESPAPSPSVSVQDLPGPGPAPEAPGAAAAAPPPSGGGGGVKRHAESEAGAGPADVSDEDEGASEPRICRYCFDDDEAAGPLIAPCACKGGQRWVH